MSDRVKEYLRLLAVELIDRKATNDERDELWWQMEKEERQETNQLVADIFGQWI